MMSGPPLKRFENSSHLDEFGPSRGRTGEEARSILGGLSFASSPLNHKKISFFLPAPPRFAPARASESFFCQPP